MTVLQALVIGLVQGLTEMLPVSSDGHLAILQSLWRMPEGGRVGLTAALHLGTALALLVYFGRRLVALVRDAFGPPSEERKTAFSLAGKVALATVPAAAVGLLVEGQVEAITSRMPLVGALLIANGAILVASRLLARGHRLEPGWKTALAVGCAQVAALLPGISRSGTTIATALVLGMAAPAAFEFSFLMAVPVTLGVATLKLVQLDFSQFQPALVVLGIVTAFVSGTAAIAILRRVVVSGRLFWFGVYCAVLGLVTLVLGG